MEESVREKYRGKLNWRKKRIERKKILFEKE